MVESPGSHAIYVSRPEIVASIIKKAAGTLLGRTAAGSTYAGGKYPLRVIRDQTSRLCLPVDVGFSAKAT